jgi:hypothetical protein
MKTTIKPRCWIIGILAAVCAMAMSPSTALAQVSETDFQSLKEAVQKLTEKVQKLEQTHDQDQQTHQKDIEQLRQLQQQLGETQKTVTDVQQKAVTVVPVEGLPRTPLDEATVNHNFSILGDAEVQYAKASGQHGTFLFADFAPIFLYRGGDKVLFEAGFDFALQNNAQPTIQNPGTPGESLGSTRAGGSSTSINLSFAQLDYLINDYVTLVAGDILLPLGTYSERTAGWLNKMPDDPLARDLLPGSGIGAQLRGAVPLGQTGKLVTYSVWGVNGPSSADGTGNAGALDLGGNVGLRSDNAVANLHGQPSGGGRLGVFMPFRPHFDLELGFSGQTGTWDDAGQHLWYAGVFDASLHLGSSLEVKGEFIRTQYGSDDLGNIRPEGWWVQAGYKLAGLNLDWPVINNLEIVNRFDSISDGQGTRTRRYTVGYIYYISNTLLFEGDYEFLHSSDPAAKNQLLLQLSYGF